MKTVMAESDGGLPNLFCSWFQRVLHLGIGEALFQPINVVEWTGVRDAVLLKHFDWCSQLNFLVLTLQLPSAVFLFHAFTQHVTTKRVFSIVI